MLFSGQYFLHVVRAFKIYTEFVPYQFVQNQHLFDMTLHIDLCTLLTSLSDGIMFLHHESLWVHTISGDSSTISNPVQEKNKTHMFYVANVITFSVFQKVLLKFTLLICYKINIFQPPRVNHFDIRALLFWQLCQVHTAIINCQYRSWETFPSGSLSMSKLDLTLFPLSN